MDKLERDLPENLLDRLFSLNYNELNEADKSAFEGIVSAEDYEACRDTMVLLDSARLDIRPDAAFKSRMKSVYEQRRSDKQHRYKHIFLKVAAVALLIIANAALINYYLGSRSDISPAVSGADSINSSKQEDTLRRKNLDSIHNYRKDTVLAIIPDTQFELMNFEKLALHSLFCVHQVREKLLMSARTDKEKTFSI